MHIEWLGLLYLNHIDLNFITRKINPSHPSKLDWIAKIEELYHLIIMVIVEDPKTWKLGLL